MMIELFYRKGEGAGAFRDVSHLDTQALFPSDSVSCIRGETGVVDESKGIH